MLSAAHVYLCDDSPKGHTETYNGQTFSTAALHQQMIDALYQDHGIPVIRVTRNKTPGGETNPKSSNLNNCLRQIYGDSIPPPAEVRTTSFDLLKCATTSVCAHNQVIHRSGGGLHNLRGGVAAQHALARGQAPLSMGQLVYTLRLVLASNSIPALHASLSCLQVVAVFDADQAAHNFFFTSVLPWMDAGEDVAVVQSPQVGCLHS